MVRQAQGPFSREGTRCGPKGRWELGVAAGGGLGSQAQGARVAEAVRSGLGRNQASRQAQGATAHLPSKSPSAWGCLWVESSSSGPETHLGGRDQGGQPVSNWVESAVTAQAEEGLLFQCGPLPLGSPGCGQARGRWGPNSLSGAELHLENSKHPAQVGETETNGQVRCQKQNKTNTWA